MEQKVLYKGQVLILTRFWATGEPCLWITDPQQIGMPKMEFVGGYPDEYCIFLQENLVYGLLTLSKLECPKWSLLADIQMNTAFS